MEIPAKQDSPDFAKIIQKMVWTAKDNDLKKSDALNRIRTKIIKFYKSAWVKQRQAEFDAAWRRSIPTAKKKYTNKDVARMEYLHEKAKGDDTKLIKFALIMSKKIKDKAKRERRAAAAKAYFGGKIGKELAKIFLQEV